jgi:hypothetical protein
MVSLTLSVSSDMKKEMDQYDEINWSAVARNAIKEKLSFLEKLEKISKKSDLTKKDAIELGKIIKKSAYKKKNEADKVSC